MEFQWNQQRLNPKIWLDSASTSSSAAVQHPSRDLKWRRLTVALVSQTSLDYRRMKNFPNRDCLFTSMKTVAFTSGIGENVPSKNKSASWFKCLWRSSATCQNSRSKLDLRPDWLFIPLKLSLFTSQMSKAAFHWCETREWSYGWCSNNEAHPHSWVVKC